MDNYVKLPGDLRVPELQEWELTRLLDRMYDSYTYRTFINLMVQGYLFDLDLSITPVEFPRGVMRVGSKILTARDIQFHKDVFFVRPHIVVQVPMKAKLLTVGFWADNLDRVKQWMSEELPNVHADLAAERVFGRRIPLD